MKVVLDTNVFVSGVFFAGPPAQILDAWREGRLTVVVSAPVLDEYRRVGRLLAARYEGVDLEPLLALLAVHSLVVEPAELPHTICEDPDDDKFLGCAIASRASIVISGDKALRRVSGWRGVQVLSPRQFLERFLSTAPEPGG